MIFGIEGKSERSDRVKLAAQLNIAAALAGEVREQHSRAYYAHSGGQKIESLKPVRFPCSRATAFIAGYSAGGPATDAALRANAADIWVPARLARRCARV